MQKEKYCWQHKNQGKRQRERRTFDFKYVHGPSVTQGCTIHRFIRSICNHKETSHCNIKRQWRPILYSTHCKRIYILLNPTHLHSLYCCDYLSFTGIQRDGMRPGRFSLKICSPLLFLQKLLTVAS